ncbi:MAG TPA: BON domain-containing protein [Nitrospiraceae bacterium]|nr:BON domain-containing protein [Nitrospiraceae bacterium]
MEARRTFAGYRRLSLCLFLILSLTGCAGSPQDEAIGRAVTRALIDYELTNLNRIDVSSDQGTVYLSGDVETNEQKERAEQIARRVKGVQHVVNKLQVQP